MAHDRHDRHDRIYLKFWFGESFGMPAVNGRNEPATILQILPLSGHDVLAIHQAWMESNDARNFNEVTTLVEEFPEIDLVICGQTHRNMPGHKIGPRTWYVQAGHAAKSLGVVRAVLDTEKHEVVEINSWLMNVQEDTPDCPELQKALALWLEIDSKAKTQPIVPAPAEDILSKGRPGVNCQASELLCAAIAEAANAPIALHGTLSKKNLLAGKAHGKRPVRVRPLRKFHRHR